MTYAPTLERLTHGFVQKPINDQKQSRQYHRALDLFDRLHNKGDLDMAQYTAALKLRRHYEGSLGRDVRQSDEFTGELRDLDGIPAQTYHSDKIVEAKGHVSPTAWRILEFALLGCERLDDLGRFVLKTKCRKKARHGAREAVQGALENLAVLWGLTHHPPSR